MSAWGWHKAAPGFFEFWVLNFEFTLRYILPKSVIVKHLAGGQVTRPGENVTELILNTGTPRGVLLVSDSENTLGMLGAILNQNEETALMAQTVEDAWGCLRTGTVGCVVHDLTATSLDALTLFRAARSSQGTEWIPFLFLIARDFPLPALERGGAELVHDCWLGLPCSAQLFLTTVRSLLNQKISRQTQALLKLPAVAETKPAEPSHCDPDALLTDKGAIFTGQIGTLDVTKILGMLEPLRLTGLLRVADGKRLGRVHFVEGCVRHAEMNEIEGPDALFLLFHLKSGNFRFDSSPPPQRQTIAGNTMQLLLEGMRQMDEAKALVKAFHQKRAGQGSAGE